MAARRRTRERLIDAAADLFWSQGYGATSIAEVAVAAGIPAGNVFYHFRTKADLARAVARLFIAEAAASLAEIDRRHAAPEARILAFLDLLAAATASRVARGCPVARATRDFPPMSDEEGPAQVFRTMIDWLSVQLEASGRDGAAARSAAQSAVARWQGAIVLASGLADPDVLVGELAALKRDLVTGSSAPSA